MKSTLFKLLLISVSMVIMVQGSNALLDPSVSYCAALGYNITVKQFQEGEAVYCVLPNGQEVDSWDFLHGTVATQYSGCAKQGYSLKSVTDEIVCSSIFSDSCSVCVLDNGQEIEVTELMNLSFGEPEFNPFNHTITSTNNGAGGVKKSTTTMSSPGFGSITASLGLSIGFVLAMLWMDRMRGIRP